MLGQYLRELHFDSNLHKLKGFCLDPIAGPGQRDETCKKSILDPLLSEGSFFIYSSNGLTSPLIKGGNMMKQTTDFLKMKQSNEKNCHVNSQ
ncbi:hypothetical protein GCM10020331_053890 [Ectobacillus funiculus]